MSSRSLLVLGFCLLVSRLSAETLSPVYILSVSRSPHESRLTLSRPPAVSRPLRKLLSNVHVATDSEIRRELLDPLNEVLEEELKEAEEAYEQMQFAKIRNLLRGRLDPEALVWQALACFSEGETDPARHWLTLLHLQEPHTFSSKDYPPAFIALSDEVRRGHRQELAPADWDGEAQAAWHRRLRKSLRGGVMILSLDPVGWNRKLRAHIFLPGRFWEKQIEIRGRPSRKLWKEAAARLRPIFEIDTRPAQK